MCKRQAPLAAACCLVPVGSSMAPPSPWAGWGRCASPLLWLGLFWVFMMIIGVLRNSEFSSRNPTIFAGNYPTSILSFKVGIHVFWKLEPPCLDLMPLGNWTLWRKPSVAPSLGEGLSSLRSCQPPSTLPGTHRRGCWLWACSWRCWDRQHISYWLESPRCLLR